MLIEPIYYAVFFDRAKPKDVQHALNKRITATNYKNLTDDNGTKTVELKTAAGRVASFSIVSVATFNISNTVDNHFFVVCDVEQIKN